MSSSPTTEGLGVPRTGTRAGAGGRWVWVCGWMGCTVTGGKTAGQGLLCEGLVTPGKPCCPAPRPPGKAGTASGHHEVGSVSLRGQLQGPWSSEPAGPHRDRGGEQTQTALRGTHLEAVKMCLALVQMALMGLSWPLISPMGVKFSTFQTLMTPARQALSSMGRPGTKARAHTQSLCALGICCRTGR